ncbi:unnamed protein product [Fusarium venenatum]|uniref:Uncharacterized protein n=1 Tax=Fusarium venenatum TaxID=56646 RepID=A0A2L2TVA1_9HYPO|nr:uncharacterized protein FVRRES_01972 [Fusarium venenatum]CEI65460.1 unnamed protein product [Fusarium venenatum]
MGQLQSLVCRILFKFRSSPSTHPPHEKQKPDCFLLSLPIEMLGLINEHLPYSGRAETRPYIRDVRESDMPNRPICRPVFGGPPWFSEVVFSFQHGALMVEHKHVQLATKYSQLEMNTCQQARYLKLLLKPYTTVFKPDYTPGPLYEATELCCFLWYPKIVSVRQRRAMWERPMEDQTHSNHEPKQLMGWHPECSDPFYECLQNAYYMHGIWFDGMCPWCLTEFSVCIEKSGDLVINTRRDLGDADTPLDDWWDHADYFTHARNDTGRNPWVIRARYGVVNGRWKYRKTKFVSHFGHYAPDIETQGFTCTFSHRRGMRLLIMVE